MRLGIFFAPAILACGIASVAEAQNLVPNHEFDTNVSGWTLLSPTGTLAWDPMDWQGSSASGSALLTNDSAPTGYAFARSDCMPNIAPGSYELGGEVFIEDGAPPGSVMIWVVFAEDPGCILPSNPISQIMVSTATTGVWLPLLVQGIVIQPPFASAHFLFRVDESTPGGHVAVRFDHLRFGLDGTTPVALESLTVE